MLHHCTFAALSLTLLDLAAAHGGGMTYHIDGVIHRGNLNWPEYANKEGSAQYSWEWNYQTFWDPAKQFVCRSPANPHPKSYHAPLIAGNVVIVIYSQPGSDDRFNPGKPYTFGHPYGPMMAYLARCPDEGCERLDVTLPVWFKIWEAGLLYGTREEGRWELGNVFRDKVNVDIQTPKSLRPGKFLLRHEVLNLETGPPQWFPNCFQLDVSGTGDSLPDAKELVAFPAAYLEDEGKSFSTSRGVDWWFENKDETVYQIPGPAVWQG